jgi:hypothetical protein
MVSIRPDFWICELCHRLVWRHCKGMGVASDQLDGFARNLNGKRTVIENDHRQRHNSPCHHVVFIEELSSQGILKQWL